MGYSIRKNNYAGQGYCGFTIHDAALEGYVEAVEELLGRGAAIEAQDEEDWVPLHYAAQAGKHSDITSKPGKAYVYGDDAMLVLQDIRLL